MSNINIVCTSKDKNHHNFLGKEKQSQLLRNIADIVQLSDADMEAIKGAGGLSICWAGSRQCSGIYHIM